MTYCQLLLCIGFLLAVFDFGGVLCCAPAWKVAAVLFAFAKIMKAGQGSSVGLDSVDSFTDGTLAFPAYSCGLSLSLLLHPYPLSTHPPTHPPLPALSRSWSAVWLGMWMDARTNGWIPCSLWLFSNLRTQLPGETTMTPPPHTQPAHRGPPVGDTLHRAATTAVSKVSATQKLAPTVPPPHTRTRPQKHSIYFRTQA